MSDIWINRMHYWKCFRHLCSVKWKKHVRAGRGKGKRQVKRKITERSSLHMLVPSCLMTLKARIWMLHLQQRYIQHRALDSLFIIICIIPNQWSLCVGLTWLHLTSQAKPKAKKHSPNYIMLDSKSHLNTTLQLNSTFLIFAFSPRIRWEDWYRSHVCMRSTKLQPS